MFNLNEVDISEIAGKNFKKILLNKKITQQKFADSFGVDVRTIRNWFKNLSDLVTIQRIVLFLDIELKDILEGLI